MGSGLFLPCFSKKQGSVLLFPYSYCFLIGSGRNIYGCKLRCFTFCSWPVPLFSGNNWIVFCEPLAYHHHHHHHIGLWCLALKKWDYKMLTHFNISVIELAIDKHVRLSKSILVMFTSLSVQKLTPFSFVFLFKWTIFSWEGALSCPDFYAFCLMHKVMHLK